MTELKYIMFDTYRISHLVLINCKEFLDPLQMFRPARL